MHSLTEPFLTKVCAEEDQPKRIGLIAGNGTFPILFAESAKKKGYEIVAVCHIGETDRELESQVSECVWIKVGQLGKLIDTFQRSKIDKVAMVGGINRVKLFGGISLDLRGASLLARLRSTKDDVLMRGIAEELLREQIEVVPSTCFMEEYYVQAGVLTSSKPTADEMKDIEVGVSALQAMSSQDIGQLVVVREGVVVAVEAVEGTDQAIRRGGELGGKGCVIVKFSKVTQDMRFDVPTIGEKTIASMIAVKARVLAIEAGKCLILNQDKVVALADRHKISIIAL